MNEDLIRRIEDYLARMGGSLSPIPAGIELLREAAAALSAPKPLDDPKLQELFSSAIDGAMASGFQGVSPAPAGHWLAPWWERGRQAALSAQGEPVATVVASQPYDDGSPRGHELRWAGRNEANDFPVGTLLYTAPQAPAQPVALSQQDREVIEDIRVMARDAGAGFWPRALALATLRILNEHGIISGTLTDAPQAPSTEPQEPDPLGCLGVPDGYDPNEPLPDEAAAPQPRGEALPPLPTTTARRPLFSAICAWTYQEPGDDAGKAYDRIDAEVDKLLTNYARAALASVPPAVPQWPSSMRVADVGFRYIAEEKHHIPTILLEFAAVPTSQHGGQGWEDRDAMRGLLTAAPHPPVQP